MFLARESRDSAAARWPSCLMMRSPTAVMARVVKAVSSACGSTCSHNSQVTGAHKWALLHKSCLVIQLQLRRCAAC